jgi:hypothetical protein
MLRIVFNTADDTQAALRSTDCEHSCGHLCLVAGATLPTRQRPDSDKDRHIASLYHEYVSLMEAVYRTFLAEAPHP